MNETTAEDAEVKAIAMEIEQYLEKHPRSKDSLEGIRSWWLTHGPRPLTPAKVEKALDSLAVRGVVSKERLADGRVIYAAVTHKDAN